MKKFFKITAVLCLLALAVGSPCAKKAKAKPKPKAKTTQSQHVVKGSVAFSGENAVFGTQYSLGKSDPMNITVKSAAFSADRVMISKAMYIPNADQKMLILKFRLQNPRKDECYVNWAVFSFTVVDSNNTNWEYISDIGVEKNNESLGITLKPTQAIDVYTAIKVPADVEIPKLIIKATDDTVLRYDLKDKIKGLEAPYASDATGVKAYSKVPAKLDVFYPHGLFDLALNSYSYTNKSMNENYDREDGNHYLVLNVTIKNKSLETQSLGWSTFKPVLKDTDGVDLEWNQDLYRATRNETISMNMEPNQEIKCRYFYQVPTDLQVQSFSIFNEGENGRVFVYDVSDAK